MASDTKPWILCDIDGTISNGEHRQHLLDNAEAENVDVDWDEYHELGHYDQPYQEMVFLLQSLDEIANIAFLTARPEKFLTMTCQWLNTHTAVPNYEIYMRKEGDWRRAHEVKADIVTKNFAPPRRVWLALEDHLPVVRMYRERGILCLQPRERE